MPVITDGATFKAFWRDDKWCPPEDTHLFVEDECVYLGPEKPGDNEPLDQSDSDYRDDKLISDTEIVTLVGGDLVDDRPGIKTRTPLERILRDWIKIHQAVNSPTSTIPRDHLIRIVSALRAMPSMSEEQFDSGYDQACKDVLEEIEAYPGSGFVKPLYKDE